MRMFWALYGVLPFLLIIALFSNGFAAPTAAAPGLVEPVKLVQFEATENTSNPNETLALVNQERLKQNLEPLFASEPLGQLAKRRAEDMAKRQYYAHKNPDGNYYYDYFSDYSVEAGYSCENLDLVFVPSQQQVIKEWLTSLNGHRDCMMNQKTTHAGYAATQLTLVNFEGKETVAYLVVAIHAEL